MKNGPSPASTWVSSIWTCVNTRTRPILAAERLAGRERRVLEVEERQRLIDFAEQFDLLLGDAQLKRTFDFGGVISKTKWPFTVLTPATWNRWTCPGPATSLTR